MFEFIKERCPHLQDRIGKATFKYTVCYRFECHFVPHIWTQDSKVSEHCATASLIDNVVDNVEDMIGQVDAMLLARDDPENHVAMAKPFLDADVPIFIDKPLATTWAYLDYFTKQHVKGKFLMSCSALRYSPGNRSARAEIDSLGEIELATAIGKKDWVRYGEHMLEGQLKNLKVEASMYTLCRWTRQTTSRYWF